MLSLLALLLSSSAFAVPIQFNHQGRLLDDSGEGLTGQHQLTFTFFDDPDNGYSQWTETLDATFTNGYYSVFLGMDEEGNPLDDAVFAGHPLWLELSVDGEELEPRHQLGSVPYAQIAAVAESVDGGPVNASDLSINGTQVIDSDGNWVGSIDWANASGMDASLADGVDDDTLAGLSCAAGELVGWDGSGWVCVSDNTLTESEVEAMVTNSALDLYAGTTLDGNPILTGSDTLTPDWGDVTNRPAGLDDGDDDTQLTESDVEGFVSNDAIDLHPDTTVDGLAIVTTVDDSDTLAALSCVNDGEIARYDLALGDWYCDADVDTVLSAADVEGYVTDGALDLYAGTTLDGNSILTAADTLVPNWSDIGNRPAGLDDGDDDNQLSQVQVLGYVQSASVNLATGSMVDGSSILTQPSTCADGQVMLYNLATASWACGADTDTTLSATEVQAMVEAVSGLAMQAGATVDGSLVLTEESSLNPVNLDVNTASSGQVLTYDGNSATWGDGGGESCAQTLYTHSDGSFYILFECNGYQYVSSGVGNTNVFQNSGSCIFSFVEYDNNGVISIVDCNGTVTVVRGAHQSTVLLDSLAFETQTSNSTHCGFGTSQELVCWGSDGNNQITDVPVGAFVQVASGTGHKCALSTSGTLDCWGYDGDGQVSNTPSGSFTSVSSGNYHSCAISSSGTVSCWGRDSRGQVSNVPGDVFQSLVSGEEFTCGIMVNNKAKCWGGHYYNLIGNVASDDFSSLSAAGHHLCGITTSGTTSCWGLNNNAQVDDAPSDTMVQLASSNSSTCGINSSGEILCWGYINNAPAGTYIKITASGSHFCALSSSASVECWGYGANNYQNLPITGVFSDIQSNNYGNCGILDTGNVICWGHSNAEDALYPP